MAAIDSLPGFRRRFLIVPADGWVRADVEDDYHHMSVVVHHHGGIATAVEPRMIRAPWTTCPGAEARLRETFEGVTLADFPQRGEKFTNCTHLHDLATLAAAHAADDDRTIFDVLVSDPIDGKRSAELRRDGETIFSWIVAGFDIIAPAVIAGMSLDKLRPWIETLAPDDQEAARILRWGVMIASGRIIPLADQSDARKMPSNCFTFQPVVRDKAVRVGLIRDFSTGSAGPLDGYTGEIETQRRGRSKHAADTL